MIDRRRSLSIEQMRSTNEMQPADSKPFTLDTFLVQTILCIIKYSYAIKTDYNDTAGTYKTYCYRYIIVIEDFEDSLRICA